MEIILETSTPEDFLLEDNGMAWAIIPLPSHSHQFDFRNKYATIEEIELLKEETIWK